MNFQGVLILLVTIVSITLEYKVDCPNNGNKCSICMTPQESAYKTVFLTTIPEKVLELGLDIDSYDNDEYAYNFVNQQIKNNVDQKTMQQFVEKLGQYVNPTKITIVSDLSQCEGKSYN
uniref:Uncharacterized protein n=1 Tax=Strongyloides papillosus TaxID=174720 RepID=A0A0N5BU10_STREA